MGRPRGAADSMSAPPSAPSPARRAPIRLAGHARTPSDEDEQPPSGGVDG